MKKIINYKINNNTYTVIDTHIAKDLKGIDYNFHFIKENGLFLRWGKTLKTNAIFSPIGPEILDIEITTKCSGVPNYYGIKSPCKFCYKSNNENGENMSFETFKKIIDILPLTLTQVAFGVDSEANSNPDLIKMMEYCRSKYIVPNITIANLSDSMVDSLSKLCGGIAVSRYENKDICYNTVKKLTDKNLKQINIHQMVSEETYDQCIETINDVIKDKRLEKLNAIVFLSLKQKGRGRNFKMLSTEKFSNIIKLCEEKNINYGGDSCSASKIMNYYIGKNQYDKIRTLIEPCESLLFSYFVDVKGFGYPCSFTNDTKYAINLCQEGLDFIKDVWYNPISVEWRKNLINNTDKLHLCRKCPIYDI